MAIDLNKGGNCGKFPIGQVLTIGDGTQFFVTNDVMEKIERYANLYCTPFKCANCEVMRSCSVYKRWYGED